jgi:lipid-binding SYLF domain-containing protein
MRQLLHKSLSIASIFLLTAVLGASAEKETKQQKRVEESIDVLNQIVEIPEKAIPLELLKDSYGIAIIPDVLKAAFGLGGRYGKGVLMIKQRDGSWGYPVFITVTGGSIGWQIGAQSSDIVLVFRTDRSIDRVLDGDFTLGAQASVAAGPVGRHAEASTNAQLEAEIFSYARSRGLFAGISLEGAAIRVDEDSNEDFYGSDEIDARAIVLGNIDTAPPLARELQKTVNAVTSREGKARKREEAS